MLKVAGAGEALFDPETILQMEKLSPQVHHRDGLRYQPWVLVAP